MKLDGLPNTGWIRTRMKSDEEYNFKPSLSEILTLVEEKCGMILCLTGGREVIEEIYFRMGGKNDSRR